MANLIEVKEGELKEAIKRHFSVEDTCTKLINSSKKQMWLDINKHLPTTKEFECLLIFRNQEDEAFIIITDNAQEK